MKETTTSTGRILVWDVLVRAFHWSLVALTGFLLGATWIEIHIWAGGAAAG